MGNFVPDETPSSSFVSGRYGLSAVFFVDGTHYFYGGFGNTDDGYRTLNDLMSYDVSGETFSSVKENSVVNDYGNYSTPPTTAFQGFWYDAATDYLYRFGGAEFFNNTLYPVNDMWKVRPSPVSDWMIIQEYLLDIYLDSNTSQYVVNETSYVFDSDDIPSPRYSFVQFQTTSHFYLFGGFGMDVNGEKESFLADIWKYEISSNIWTHSSGPRTRNFGGNATWPCARSQSTFWMSASGTEVMIFGGETENGAMNDLWSLSVQDLVFTLIQSNRSSSSFGNEDTFESSNYPAARSGSFAMRDPVYSDFVNVYGGIDGAGSLISEMLIFNENNFEWAYYSCLQCEEFPSDNSPGKRALGVAWSDEDGSNIHLYGGYGQYAGGSLPAGGGYSYQIGECYGVSVHDSQACYGNGVCSDYDTCNCTEGYYGFSCAEKIDSESTFQSNMYVIDFVWQSFNSSISTNGLTCADIIDATSMSTLLNGDGVTCQFDADQSFSSLTVTLDEDSKLCPTETITLHPLSDPSVSVDVECAGAASYGNIDVQLSTSVSCESENLISSTTNPGIRPLSWHWIVEDMNDQIVYESRDGYFTYASNFTVPHAVLEKGDDYKITAQVRSVCYSQTGKQNHHEISCESYFGKYDEPEEKNAFVEFMENYYHFVIMGGCVIAGLLCLCCLLCVIVVMCLALYVFGFSPVQIIRLDKLFGFGDGDAANGIRYQRAGDDDKKVDIELKKIISSLPVKHQKLTFTFKRESLSHLTNVKILSSGVTLLKGWNEERGESMMVKCFNSTYVDSFNVFFSEVEREAKLLKQLTVEPHPNVVEFFGVYNDYPRIGFVTSYHHRTLKQLLEKGKGKIKFESKVRILLDIAKGLKYLHSLGIIHRFLTLDNIVIDNENSCRIANFALSRYLYYQQKQRGMLLFGPYYQAPELTEDGFVDEETEGENDDEEEGEDEKMEEDSEDVKLSDTKSSPEADIFSFGMIIYQILVEEKDPFFNQPQLNVAEKMMKDKKFRPKVPKKNRNKQNEWIIELMKECWMEKSKRPSLDQIVNKFDHQLNELESTMT